jgi:hypothetical protein
MDICVFSPVIDPNYEMRKCVLFWARILPPSIYTQQTFLTSDAGSAGIPLSDLASE